MKQSEKNSTLQKKQKSMRYYFRSLICKFSIYQNVENNVLEICFAFK